MIRINSFRINCLVHPTAALTLAVSLVLTPHTKHATTDHHPLLSVQSPAHLHSMQVGNSSNSRTTTLCHTIMHRQFHAACTANSQCAALCGAIYVFAALLLQIVACSLQCKLPMLACACTCREAVAAGCARRLCGSSDCCPDLRKHGYQPSDAAE